MENQNRVKVLYIAGFLRSGSTLLDRILGQVPGLTPVGELTYLWEEGLLQNLPCGCEERLSECAFWRSVIEDGYGGLKGAAPEVTLELKRRVDRMRHIPQLMSRLKAPEYRGRLEEYKAQLGKLYQAINNVTESQVIVDSSKSASYAYVLANLDNIDLYVVHLVRDSRAVAYSWRKKKLKYRADSGETVYMDRYSPGKSARGWLRANLLAEPLRFYAAGYKRVLYEDLISSPETKVAEILKLVGKQDEKLPFIEDNTVTLSTNHTVAGNSNRFQSGTVELRSDNEWQFRMSPPDYRKVTAMTWPLLVKYGYSSARG